VSEQIDNRIKDANKIKKVVERIQSSRPDHVDIKPATEIIPYEKEFNFPWKFVCYRDRSQG
jgi:hypothetical protein